MLIEVSQKLLAIAIQQISPAISTKTTIPILAGIKLAADNSGLTLTMGNMGMMMQYKLPNDNHDVIVHKIGSVVLPSRYFADIIRTLPTGSVKLEVKDNLNTSIQSGNAIYHLSGMDPEEYPQVTKLEHLHKLSLSNGHLKSLIRKVAFAISSSESKPVLTGVSCQINNERLRLVATDGIRLSSQTSTNFNSEQFAPTVTNIIIPGKHLSDYSKMLSDEHATTDISIGDRAIIFKTRNLYMQSSLIEGTYPSIVSITPKSCTTEITTDTDTLLRALERVTLMAGESHVVRMRAISDKSIELCSKTVEIGDVTEEVPMEALSGVQITVSFNGKFMIDIIRSIDSSKLKLKLAGKSSPIIVEPTDCPTSFYMITPIRTRD